MAHPLLPFWAPSMYWAISITDAAVTLNKRSQAPLSATFLTGTAILLIGTSLRILCFRVLGRHFTLAMSLQDDHSLVTSGPYAVVRHPSYTGGLLQALGACLVGAGAGSWLADGGYATPWGAFLGLNLAILTVMWGYACTRGAKEDEFLAEKFGEKWKVYAQAVPYRYVPGVC
ncbi:hypothetical protein B0H15DRAFT_840754 [Mycena belliarum]|uniref:Protein-S-isoprenylcysteine O-methyltransferase n=1 Tax=Mycena belliarum TaxID=1033014 RepID=A0AAD6U314_9AGAR|nr:hypothetical protein B0H15DRAFT_840754 [Mycena belliae]